MSHADCHSTKSYSGAECHSAEFNYTEYFSLSVILLNSLWILDNQLNVILPNITVIMLYVTMLYVIMLNVTMLNVTMLNVIMLNVIMLMS